MATEGMIKDALKDKKPVIGRQEVLRMAKLGLLESIIYAVNCPPQNVEELEYYSRISKIGLHKFGKSSSNLGQLCGKPFNIIILGIKK